MRTRIQKWGNSLALRIPKSFAAEAQLAQDSIVNVSVVNGGIVITPERTPQQTLEALLARVTTENVHHEVDMGPSAGKEVW